MFAIDDFGAPPAAGFEIDATAAAILGAGLPAGAERHLRAAGEAYHQDDVAETHLLAALQIAPDHPAALIGLYRFYFYKGRLLEALEVARMCLAKATRELGVHGRLARRQPETLRNLAPMRRSCRAFSCSR